MGCQYCKRTAQIPEIEEPIEYVLKKPINEPKKITKVVKDKNIEFFVKARRFIKNVLSEDEIYQKTLDYILLFDEEQFEHLFNGDDEYKKYPYHLIDNMHNFKTLLWKLEDHNSLVYEWYDDSTKLDIFVKLWKANICIYDLSKKSNNEIKEELEKKAKIIMSDDDLIEFINIISSRTIETKASDIKNYLKLEEDYFVSLTQTINEYKEYFEESDIDENNIISKNLDNINKKLIEESLPLIKDYINKNYPNLNASAKRQLETRMHKKLRNELLDKIIHDKEAKKKGVDFKVVLTLSEIVNKAKIINKFVKVPVVGEVIDIANSFLNLATSIKTYYDEMYEYDKKDEKYILEFKKIHEEFEMHKKQLDLLDLNDYEGSLKAINLIGNKINQDKKNFSTAYRKIEDDEKNAKNKEQKSKIISIATSGASTLASIGAAIGTAAITGGFSVLAFGIVAGINAAICGVNVARLIKLREQLKKYEQRKIIEREYYEKICKTITEGISKKKDEIRKAFINKYSPKSI